MEASGGKYRSRLIQLACRRIRGRSSEWLERLRADRSAVLPPVDLRNNIGSANQWPPTTTVTWCYYAASDPESAVSQQSSVRVRHTRRSQRLSVSVCHLTDADQLLTVLRWQPSSFDVYITSDNLVASLRCIEPLYTVNVKHRSGVSLSVCLPVPFLLP